MPARTIQPAVRSEQKARVALQGPEGSGKTWSALSIAREFVQNEMDRILVIDTESDRSLLYADDFTHQGKRFAHCPWAPPYNPKELADFLLAQAERYDVLIVDSLSHFWMGPGGTLSVVDDATARSRSGNSFNAWSVATPMQDAMVQALIRCPAHVLACMRVKTKYELEFDERTKKNVPRKYGLGAVQRDGIAYEFDVVVDLDQEHRLLVTKSRCHLIADRVYQPHGESEFARVLNTWLHDAKAQEGGAGVPAAVQPALIAEPAAAATPASPPPPAAEAPSATQGDGPIGNPHMLDTVRLLARLPSDVSAELKGRHGVDPKGGSAAVRALSAAAGAQLLQNVRSELERRGVDAA